MKKGQKGRKMGRRQKSFGVSRKDTVKRWDRIKEEDL
jgi:hypothetical protein